MFPQATRKIRVSKGRFEPPGENRGANALSSAMRKEMRSHSGLARLADRQHGVVSIRQLRALGYSEAAVTRATAAGRLHRIHRRVYAVGRLRLSTHGRCFAAVAACGSDALLSHGSAAWLWGLLPNCPVPADVSVPRRGHPRHSIHLHHAPALTDSDRAQQARIPVTAVPRTLLDLASSATPARLRRSIESAERLQRFDLRAIDALLARTRGHPGSGRLRAALRTYREPAFTRSELERRFLRLLREAGLPRPAANIFIAGYELDAYWEEERFAVELDTYDFHGGHAAFESDRLRQEDLKLAGIEMTRVTGNRVDREPDVVMDRLRRLLEQRRRELGR
jgi:very-short-patch-repair endonuclease